MPKSDLRIDLLGTSFSVTVDEDPLYMESLMSRYRRLIENTQNITGLTDPLKTAILAGFQLCDEVEKLRSREAGASVIDDLQAEKLTIELIERIDKAFP
ncbi:MAG: cell division protein ZapA [Termitinemataceae bacterium]|nr:MAG: cell division protein ZapA [Termitinemataceae bacterium]